MTHFGGSQTALLLRGWLNWCIPLAVGPDFWWIIDQGLKRSGLDESAKEKTINLKISSLHEGWTRVFLHPGFTLFVSSIVFFHHFYLTCKVDSLPACCHHRTSADLSINRQEKTCDFYDDLYANSYLMQLDLVYPVWCQVCNNWWCRWNDSCGKSSRQAVADI